MRLERKRKSQSKKTESDLEVQTLLDNLKRTPAERIRRHQIALDTMKKLQKATLVKSNH
jgi:hypothetical protein